MYRQNCDFSAVFITAPTPEAPHPMAVIGRGTDNALGALTSLQRIAGEVRNAAPEHAEAVPALAIETVRTDALHDKRHRQAEALEGVPTEIAINTDEKPWPKGVNASDSISSRMAGRIAVMAVAPDSTDS